MVSVSTPLRFRTFDGEDGREIVSFIPADPPPGLNVNVAPTGSNLAGDATTWINAARSAAGIIPFATAATRLIPADAAVSVLLEHLVHSALAAKRPVQNPLPALENFTFMPGRDADVDLTGFTEADKIFLLDQGFDFRAALTLARGRRTAMKPLTDAIYQHHGTTTNIAALGLDLPLDVLRLVLRGGGLPDAYSGAVTQTLVDNARSAYDSAVAGSTSLFRPQDTFRLIVPEVFLGAGVYLRDVSGELEPSVIVRKGERFEFEQGLGVQPGTVFDVTGFTDLPPDAGRTVIDAISVAFISKPDVLDTDTDTDGLDDEWERFFFGTLALNGSFIPPGKTQTLAQFFASGADPRPLSGDPEIELEQPAGSVLASGGTRDFGVTAIGSARDLVFTIKNTGGADLTGLGVTIDGAGASQFSVVSPPVAPVTPFGSTTMTVRFLPTSSGVKTAVLHVASNDADEASYDITMTGNGVAVGLPNPVISPLLTTPNLVAVATQPDGKFIVGGTFGVTGSTALNLARLNADGTVDDSFNIGTGANNSVACINVLLGGKILVAGSFTSFNGTTVGRIVRLNADGTLDSSFNPGSGFGGAVAGITLQPDGKMIIVGSFSTFNGQSRNRLVRLNADGTLDGSFNIGAGPDNNLRTAAVQPDGKILVAGDFANFNGQARNRLVRLNADGSLESTATFNIGTGPNSTLRAMSLLPDGRIMIAGDFGSVNGITRNKIAVLSSSGAVDTSFGDAAINSSVHSFMRQTDGKVLIGGFFTTVSGQNRSRVARLTSTGALDTSFSIGTGPNNTVNGLALNGAGQVIVVGVFTAVNGSTRNGVAVLVNSTPATSITAPDRTRIEWARSGTAPEIAEADFDLSTDNGTTFTPLGKARFIAGGWDMDELSLPDTGIIRVRGATSGGLGNASAGFVQSTAAFVMNANSVPTISIIADTTTLEDTPTAAIAFTVADADTASADLQVSATSSNLTLLPQSGISLGGAGADHTITLSPAANQSGTADVTVTVSDGFRTASRTFNVSVTAVNDLPIITALTNDTVPLGTGVRSQNLVVSDVETSAASLSVTATSSNIALVPALNLSVSSTGGGGRTVSYRAVSGQVGSSTITVRVSDGTLARQTSFVFTVTNTAPVISAAFTSRTLNEDTLLLAQPFTIGDAETPASLSMSVRTSNAALVPESGIQLSGTGANRTFNLTPLPNQSGNVVITLVVSDGLLTSELPLNFTVTPVNDTPTISTIANVTILEDTPSAPIPFTVADVENDPLTISHSVLSNALGLVPSLTFTESPRTLTITPNADEHGQAAISVRVSDPAGQATQTISLGSSTSFNLTITSVNDTPVFTKGQDFSHPFGFEEAQSISGWATGISAGPANESAQALTFRLTSNSNPSLFATAPALSPEGTLTYRTQGSEGSATLAFVLEDDGGTANGGVNSSVAQTFTITVGAPQPRLAVIQDGVELVDGTGVLDFGGPSVGAVARRTLFVRNEGPAPLNLNGFSLVGDDAGIFAITPIPPLSSSLSQGSSRQFELTFSPSQVRSHSAILRFESNDPALGDGTHEITLTGRGSQSPTVRLNPPTEVTRSSALLTAFINAGQGDATVTMEAGTTLNFGLTFPVTPEVVSGGTSTLVSSRASGLLPNTLYHYRITARNDAGSSSATGVFATSNLVPGSLDLLFGIPSPISGQVFALAMLPDGKIMVGGDFIVLPSLVAGDLVRLNPDGSLDATFSSGLDTTPGRGVHAIAVQKDGRVIIGGNFETVGGVSRRLIARLDSTGALDASFAPNVNGQAVRRLVMQPDDRVIIGGQFTSVNGSARSSLARLEADGSLDAEMAPSLAGGNAEVTTLALQSDGSLVIGGDFTTINGQSQARLARLTGAGLLDTAFTPAVDGSVRSVLIQPDGRIFVAGAAVTVNGGLPGMIIRLQPAGEIDETFRLSEVPFFFQSTLPFVQDMALGVDGSLLVAGDFLFPSTASGLARLRQDGSLDREFIFRADQRVECMAMQADGKIVIGGGFQRVGNTFIPSVARLLNDPAEEQLVQSGENQIDWLRGAGAPEAQEVSFAVSTDGGTTFADLGNGVRISGGWSLLSPELAGLERYHLQVNARTISGGGTGSTGIVSTLAIHNQPDIEVVAGTGNRVLEDASATLNTGRVTIGETRLAERVLIHNAGPLPLTLGQVTLDGAHASDFSVNTAGMTPVLLKGQETFISILFTPGAAGARDAALHIASNDPDVENPFDIALTGTGVAPTPQEIAIFSPSRAELADNSGTVNLGEIEVSESRDFIFLIKNTGATPLTGLSITKTGSADYTISQPAASTLRLDEVTPFTVSVKAGAVGLRTAQLKIASNDVDENPFEINLSITGTKRDIDVAITPPGRTLLDGAGVFDFGLDLPLNVPVQRTLIIRNVGSGPLTLGNVSISGEDFSITQPGKTELSGGGADTTTCVITFLPVSGAARNGKITIESNDRDEAVFDIFMRAGGAGPEIAVEILEGIETRNLTDGVDAVAFLPATPGLTTTRTLNIRNLSAQTLTITAMNFTNGSSAGAARFTASFGQPVNIAPARARAFAFNFRSDTLGAFASTLNIVSNDPDESPFEVRVTGECLARVLPAFTAQPQPQIVALGQPVTFTAQADSPLAMRFQWSRGSVSVQATFGPLTDTPALTLPAVALTNALNYSVTATNASGRTRSLNAGLTVVDTSAGRQSLEIRKQAIFTIKAAGPGTRLFQWLKNGQPITDSQRIQGATTDKLTISNLVLTDSGAYTCEVSASGGSLIGGVQTLEVFDIAPRIAGNPLDLPRGQVARPYNFQVPLDPAGGLATSWTTKDLPAGLVINKNTGVISGKPTVSSSTALPFQITAKNTKGSSTVSARIVIDPLPTNLAGSYTGVIERGFVNNLLGGRFDLTIASTGAFSGRITLGASTLAVPPGSITLPEEGRRVPVSFLLSQGSGGSAVTRRVTFTLNPITQLISDGEIVNVLPVQIPRPVGFRAWRTPWSQTVRATDFGGYHTFGLEIPAGALGNEALPQGIGFGSFTTVVDGAPTSVAGKLADGTTFTSSSLLGPNGEMAIFQNNAKSSLVGSTSIQTGTTLIFGGSTIVPDNTLTGSLSWMRPATKDRTYAAGFSPLTLSVVGGTYLRPEAGKNMLGMTLVGSGPNDNQQNVAIAFAGGGIGALPSRADTLITLTHRTISFQRFIPPLIALTFNDSLGAFGGTFTLEDTTPLVQPAGRLVRTVPLEGIVVKDDGGLVGAGFFLMPQMPFINSSGRIVPVSQTPILSGSALMTPRED